MAAWARTYGTTDVGAAADALSDAELGEDWDDEPAPPPCSICLAVHDDPMNSMPCAIAGCVHEVCVGCAEDDEGRAHAPGLCAHGCSRVICVAHRLRCAACLCYHCPEHPTCLPAATIRKVHARAREIADDVDRRVSVIINGLAYAPGTRQCSSCDGVLPPGRGIVVDTPAEDAGIYCDRCARTVAPPPALTRSTRSRALAFDDE